MSDSGLSPKPASLRVMTEVGLRNSFSEKSICFSRAGVTAMDDMMPSNLRARRAGIRPSKSLLTQVHLTSSLAQMALPSSMSKPFRLPSAATDSKGG
ncbi:hypothetical protein D9M71_142260 [compost metagenome]